MNLIKATIGKFFPTTTTTDEPSTQTDTVVDDQGKEKKHSKDQLEIPKV